MGLPLEAVYLQLGVSGDGSVSVRGNGARNMNRKHFALCHPQGASESPCDGGEPAEECPGRRGVLCCYEVNIIFLSCLSFSLPFLLEGFRVCFGFSATLKHLCANLVGISTAGCIVFSEISPKDSKQEREREREIGPLPSVIFCLSLGKLCL